MAKLKTARKAKAASAQSDEQTVKVAVIGLPGLPSRTYAIEDDEVDDPDVVFAKYYKKEMGIRTTQRDPEVQFTEMPYSTYETQHGLERRHFLGFGRPAIGNVGISEFPTAIDRNLSEEQEEEFDEDDETGEIVPKGARTRALSEEDEEDGDEAVEEQARPRRSMVGRADTEVDSLTSPGKKVKNAAGAMKASAKSKASSQKAEEDEDEEEEEEETVEVDTAEVKQMSKPKLIALAKELGIKKPATMSTKNLRKEILAKAEEAEEEESDEDE